jgi:hypothetical protein
VGAGAVQIVVGHWRRVKERPWGRGKQAEWGERGWVVWQGNEEVVGGRGLF